MGVSFWVPRCRDPRGGVPLTPLGWVRGLPRGLKKKPEGGGSFPASSTKGSGVGSHRPVGTPLAGSSPPARKWRRPSPTGPPTSGRAPPPPLSPHSSLPSRRHPSLYPMCVSPMGLLSTEKAPVERRTQYHRTSVSVSETLVFRPGPS